MLLGILNQISRSQSFSKKLYCTDENNPLIVKINSKVATYKTYLTDYINLQN